jgi:hypothetical protein
MPKAKHTPTPAEQRKRFEAEVQRLINAGELDPGEAEKALDALVKRSRNVPNESTGG